jgi:hypothetical protein
MLTPSACTAICNEKVAAAQKAMCTPNKNRANENRFPDDQRLFNIFYFSWRDLWEQA